MNKSFIIEFYIQGEFYKQSTSKKNFNWKWMNQVENEINEMYPDYEEISSSTEGYRVLFNKKTMKAVCYHYTKVEYTGLQDANGSAIAVGDTLVKKDFISDQQMKDHMMVINNSGWDDGYYLRSLYNTEHHYKWDESGNYCGMIPAVPDIRNVNQEIMNDYIIVQR